MCVWHVYSIQTCLNNMYRCWDLEHPEGAVYDNENTWRKCEAATFPRGNSHRTINSIIHSTCGSDPSWSQEYLVEEIFGLADLGKEPHLFARCGSKHGLDVKTGKTRRIGIILKKSVHSLDFYIFSSMFFYMREHWKEGLPCDCPRKENWR